MRERGRVTDDLVGLVGVAVGDRELARRVCEACVDGLDIDGAGMSLFTTRESRQTLWATDEVAMVLEDLQLTLNEGPCIEAATRGLPVSVPDLHHSVETTRWPVFAGEVAERTDAVALFAIPMRFGATVVGVLDFYRTTAGALGAVQWRDALAAAETAALLLLGQRTRPSDLVPGSDGEEQARTTDGHDDGWFSSALSARPEIHQATGMVLAQLGIGPEEALARMRAHAFTERRLLIDVAGDVVARRLRFTEEMR
ncbi:MAG: GAF and ANTAR domain-containing protein [Pseudonocardia sp.]|nr:GAF and ANTAR domain-containing protein [Pseudonocardia sp.]